MAICTPLTGYEPNQLDNQLDNFDYSKASAAIFQDESVDIDTEPSYSCDAELDDELIGKAPSSPLFIQEREEPANLRQTYHSHEESFLPAQSFFTHKSTNQFQIFLRNGNQVATQKTSESGFSLKEPRKLVSKVFLHEKEELKRIQELRNDEFFRRRLIENQDTVNELTARSQELQNEVNCMNDSRVLKGAESVRSVPSHVPSQPALFPPYRDPGKLLSRNNQPPDIWNSQG